MIRPRIVALLFRKDIVDGLRESRVLVSLLTPIVLALLYNVMFPENKVFEAKVAYAGPESSAIVQMLRTRAEAGDAVDLKLRHVGTIDDARQLVRDKTVDVAFVLPDGIDAAIAAGTSPRISLIAPDGGNSASSFVESSIDIAARALASQRPPAQLAVENVGTGASPDQGAMAEIGPRRYFVLATVVMMLGMIAVLAVPIMLSEETEKKTLDALLLVGSYAEVIVAKALVGIAYVGVSVTVMLALTRLRPVDIPTFVAGTLVLAITLIGVGLLVGGMFKSAQQVYTWSSFLLIPVIGPAFAAGLPVPDVVDVVLRLLPTSQGMRIMTNGFAGEALFADTWLAFVVTAAWGVVAYAILAWRLSRRES